MRDNYMKQLYFCIYGFDNGNSYDVLGVFEHKENALKCPYTEEIRIYDAEPYDGDAEDEENIGDYTSGIFARTTTDTKKRYAVDEGAFDTYDKE